MRQRYTRAATVSLMIAALAACDITQEHIDEASERLAEATVAIGSPPTAEQIAAAVPLRFEHLAGSSWRFVKMSKQVAGCRLGCHPREQRASRLARRTQPPHGYNALARPRLSIHGWGWSELAR